MAPKQEENSLSVSGGESQANSGSALLPPNGRLLPLEENPQNTSYAKRPVVKVVVPFCGAAIAAFCFSEFSQYRGFTSMNLSRLFLYVGVMALLPCCWILGSNLRKFGRVVGIMLAAALFAVAYAFDIKTIPKKLPQPTFAIEQSPISPKLITPVETSTQHRSKQGPKVAIKKTDIPLPTVAAASPPTQTAPLPKVVVPNPAPVQIPATEPPPVAYQTLAQSIQEVSQLDGEWQSGIFSSFTFLERGLLSVNGNHSPAEVAEEREQYRKLHIQRLADLQDTVNQKWITVSSHLTQAVELSIARMRAPGSQTQASPQMTPNQEIAERKRFAAVMTEAERLTINPDNSTAKSRFVNLLKYLTELHTRLGDYP